MPNYSNNADTTKKANGVSVVLTFVVLIRAVCGALP